MSSQKDFEILPLGSLESLFDFSKELGIYVNPKLRYPVSFPPGYLGVLTTEDLFPYEVLLTAPNNSMLSMPLSNHSDLKEIYSEFPEEFAEGGGGENNRFIVYLLSELSKGQASKWYPYLNSLPETIETLTDWSYEELLEVQDDFLLQYCQGKSFQDQECNQILIEVLKKFPHLVSPHLAEKIPWAWKVICTRAYGKCLPYLSLIPIADFFNHQNVNTSYYYAKADEPDNGIIDNDVEDSDDQLPINLISFSYLKLAQLSVGKGSQKALELWENAKVQDRKLFLSSNQ